MRIILPFLIPASCAAAQTVPADRLTFSGGWTRQTGGSSFEDKLTATKFIEPEVGLFTALDPTGNICGRTGCVDVGERYFRVPLGVRFVAPLLLGRIELSAGGRACMRSTLSGVRTRAAVRRREAVGAAIFSVRPSWPSTMAAISGWAQPRAGFSPTRSTRATAGFQSRAI